MQNSYFRNIIDHSRIQDMIKAVRIFSVRAHDQWFGQNYYFPAPPVVRKLDCDTVEISGNFKDNRWEIRFGNRMVGTLPQNSSDFAAETRCEQFVTEKALLNHENGTLVFSTRQVAHYLENRFSHVEPQVLSFRQARAICDTKAQRVCAARPVMPINGLFDTPAV